MTKSNAATATKISIIGKAVTGAANSLRLVKPELLLINPENERDYADPNEGIDSLYQSIKAEGLKTPLQVYENGMAHDGNRRLTVINRLRAEGVPLHGTATDNGDIKVLIVDRPATPVEGIISRLNTNEARQFSAMAQSRAFSELRDSGMSATDISKRSPFTAMHVGNMLTLADAGEHIHTIVRLGQMSATLLVETLRKYGESIVVRAVQQALEDGKERATQRHVDFIVAEDEKSVQKSVASSPAVAPASGETTGEESVIEGTASEVEGTTTPVSEVEGTTTPVSEVEGTTTPVSEVEGTTTPVSEVEGTTTPVSEVEGTTTPVSEVEGTTTPVSEVEGTTTPVSEVATPAATLKWSADVGKALFVNFLPLAKRFIENDVSPEDFREELGFLIQELENYGIKVA